MLSRNNNIKVSIITVTKNADKTIEDSIKSLQIQSYNNIEHIIIDGASTDKTIDIINNFNHKQLQFISEPDKSLYDALNKGIKLATGDIIGILHADDLLYDNNVICDVVSFFDVNSNIDILFGDALFINQFNKPIRFYKSALFKPILFYFGFQPAHTATFIKSEIFKKYGLYNDSFKIAGDFDLLLRYLLKFKLKYKYFSRTIVKMRTGGKSTNGLKSLIQLNREIKKSLIINNYFSSYFLIYSKYFFKIWSFLKFK
jgi:glycosyltransferase involved in cell wall biosynthesis